MNLNKVFVLGNLTRDPERRTLPSGNAVVSFGLATNRFFTSQGQKQQEAEFHNIVIFGKLAETAAQYLKKGSLALIEGRLKTTNWQDPSSGIKRYRTEIIAERMQLGPRTAFVGSGKFQPTPSPASSSPGPAQIKDVVSEEEIPVIEEENQDGSQTQEGQSDNPPPNPSPNPFDEEDQINVKDIPF